jgi:hypothetical protein
VIPIVNWLVWLPAVIIAVRIDPRPPVMLTTSIAVAEYAMLGVVLWLIKGRRRKPEMPTTKSTLSSEAAPSAAPSER